MRARAQVEEEAVVMDLFKLLTTRGANGLSDDGKVELLQAHRGRSAQLSTRLDRQMVRLLSRCHDAIDELRSSQGKLKGIIERLTEPPWHPALFLEADFSSEGPRAVVLCGNSARLVGLAEGLEVGRLVKGDTVYLGHELNSILAVAPRQIGRFGDTAVFQRLTADGRAIISCREEEKVAELAGTLAPGDLRKGDLVRWRPETGLVFEKLDRPSGEHLLVEESPTESFADVGGLEPQIERLKRTVVLHQLHPKLVRRYGLRRAGSVMLDGYPGMGKTLLAKALANFLAGYSPAGRSLFIHVKPGAMNSMWYGQTEANYRELFRQARELAEANPETIIVLFFDEVDAIGAARGGGLSYGSAHVSDRTQTAFMSELDGLESRLPNVLVVAATNRRNALDPALVRPGRLGDVVIQIPRPNMRAAADIFARHLKPDIPYARNGHGTDLPATRQEIIDAAVSKAYAPNADNALATILFRDGRQQTIRAADLMSGALISNIARAAVEKACVRELESGVAGLQVNDVLSAMDDELASAVRMLTPFNCHQHLSGLPQDVAVASVEPVVRRVPRPHRFLNTN